MSTPVPEDENLPARLRAERFIRDGEQAVGRSWFRSLTRWLDRVRPAVRRGGGIDPGRVSDHQGFWSELVNVEVMPTISGVLSNAWGRILPGTPPGGDTFVQRYLDEAGNRLVRLPDEVYALIVAEVERGIREGLPVQDVGRSIDVLLTATGSERWPNRALTVARTETLGAVNAGIYRSAVLDAEERGDPAPFKVWLSTEDSRTRPTHQEADRQRTLMSEPFRVGGAALLFPGDPRGPAQEVINCRCSMLPVVLGETLDWTDRQSRRGSDA